MNNKSISKRVFVNNVFSWAAQNWAGRNEGALKCPFQFMMTLAQNQTHIFYMKNEHLPKCVMQLIS